VKPWDSFYIHTPFDGMAYVRAYRTLLARIFGIWALSFAAASCAAPSQYVGINLDATPTSPSQSEIQSLARQARDGDKHAQLELGKRFEAACSEDIKRPHTLPCDLKKARRLYSLAAVDTSQQTIFVPENGAVKATAVSTGKKNPVKDKADIHLKNLMRKKLTQNCVLQKMKAGFESRCKKLESFIHDSDFIEILNNYSICVHGDNNAQNFKSTERRQQYVKNFNCLRGANKSKKGTYHKDPVITSVYLYIYKDEWEKLGNVKFVNFFSKYKNNIIKAFRRSRDRAVRDLLVYSHFNYEWFGTDDFRFSLYLPNYTWFSLCPRIPRHVFRNLSGAENVRDLSIVSICRLRRPNAQRLKYQITKNDFRELRN